MTVLLDKRMPSGHLVSSPPQSPPQEAAMTPSLDRTTLALPSETRSRYEPEPLSDSRAATTALSRAGVIPVEEAAGPGTPAPSPLPAPTALGHCGLPAGSWIWPICPWSSKRRNGGNRPSICSFPSRIWGPSPAYPCPGALESRLLCCRCCAAAALKPRASGPGGGPAREGAALAPGFTGPAVGLGPLNGRVGTSTFLTAQRTSQRYFPGICVAFIHF